MHNILNLYFPEIRTLEDIASRLQENERAKKIFNEWTPEKRMHFIDICTGRTGVKLLYEPFLQEMIRGKFVREALEAHLSALTGKEAAIAGLCISPCDLILMEFSVTLQRTGELRRIRFVRESSFPPEWKHAAAEKNAYTMIVLDNSPEELRLYKEEYMYYGCGQNDCNAKKEDLGEYCVFCVDRFRDHIRKAGIKNMMDAWWVVFVCDEPDILAQLIIKYPVFKKLYQDLYHILADTERTVLLMEGNMPHTDCGRKCAWLVRAEQLLKEEKKQNATQAEKIRKMQSMIDKQAYIISEQCRENSESVCREKEASDRTPQMTHKNKRKKYKKTKKICN